MCVDWKNMCYCRAILSIAIVVLAYLSSASWMRWAIIVAGLILLVLTVTGKCCCRGSCTCAPAKPAAKAKKKR